MSALGYHLPAGVSFADHDLTEIEESRPRPMPASGCAVCWRECGAFVAATLGERCDDCDACFTGM